KYELGAEPVFFVLDAQTQLAGGVESHSIPGELPVGRRAARSRHRRLGRPPSRPNHRTSQIIAARKVTAGPRPASQSTSHVKSCGSPYLLCLEPVTRGMLSFWQPVPRYACFCKIPYFIICILCVVSGRGFLRRRIT